MSSVALVWTRSAKPCRVSTKRHFCHLVTTSSQPKIMKPSTQKNSLSSCLVRYYLVFYNIFSAIGWSVVLYNTIRHLAGLTPLARVAHATSTPTAKSALLKMLSSYNFVKAVLPFRAQVEASIPTEWIPLFERAKTSFTAVGWQTAVVQSFAILEILHVLVGWVRSPPSTTVMQVSSRLILVWGIADRFESARYNPIYTSMVLSWSVTEIIRYVFYAVNKLGYEPKWLLWLRYTTFYILYPTGAGSEAALIFSTLPSQKAWDRWTEGDFIRGLLFCIWWPGLYVMYTYMIKQRRKVLGKARPDQKLKST